MTTITIGSRDSRLAVVQTETVRDYIANNVPGITPEILTMKTTGDIILDRPLEKVGGKGLFATRFFLPGLDLLPSPLAPPGGQCPLTTRAPAGLYSLLLWVPLGIDLQSAPCLSPWGEVPQCAHWGGEG